MLLWIFALDLSGQERNDEEYFFDEKRSEIEFRNLKLCP